MSEAPKTTANPPTPAQLRLLRALYDETTMADVAKAVGYSPRHTRRLLHELLDAYDAATVRQALAKAVAKGHLRLPYDGTCERPRD